MNWAKVKNACLAVVSVLLGLVITLLVYFALVFCSLPLADILTRETHRDPEGYLWIPVLVIAPLSLGVGSLLTGLLAQPYVSGSLLGRILVIPAIYVPLIGVLSGQTETDPLWVFSLSADWFSVIMVAAWTVLSVPATWFGFFIRSCYRGH